MEINRSLICIYVLISLFCFIGDGQAELQKRDIKAFILQEEERFNQEQEQDENSFDLEGLIRLALVQNQDIKSAFQDIKKYFYKILPQSSLKQPRVKYSTAFREIETRTGAQERSYSLSQEIPFPTKLKQKKALAINKVQQKIIAYKYMQQKVIAELKKVYYEYAYKSQVYLYMKSYQKILEDADQVLKVKYKSGRIKDRDSIKIEIELEKVKEQVFALEDDKDVLLWKIKFLLNVPEQKIVEIRPFSFAKNVEGDFLNEGLKNNYELRALDVKLIEADLQKKWVNMAYYPDFQMGLTYIQTDELSESVEQNDPIIGHVQVNIPLWYSVIQDRRQEVKAIKNKAKNQKKSQENKLEVRSKELGNNIRKNIRKIELYSQVLVPKAQHMIETTQQDYASGESSFLDLIEAKKMWLDLQVQIVLYLSNYYQDKADFELLCGGR